MNNEHASLNELNRLSRELGPLAGGIKVTMTVMIYCDTVWITAFDEPFCSEAILELAHVDSLIEMLTWAAEEAYRRQDSDAV